MTVQKQSNLGPIYPSHIKLFTECHRRFLWKVVERRRVEEPYSPALAKGNAAHKVLKFCMSALTHPEPRLPMDIAGLVRGQLPPERYPSSLDREIDVAEVTTWVKHGLAYLGPYDDVLGAELFLRRQYQGDDSCAPFEAAALVDLVLLRASDDGERYIELVDWKTGRSGWEDPLAPVIARFVAKSLFAQHLPGVQTPQVVYTWLYLAEAEPVRLVLDIGLCAERWEEVKRMIGEIRDEEDWLPSPSPLCRFCPFNGNDCNAASAPPEDGEDW
jgi:hypothetical protein